MPDINIKKLGYDEFAGMEEAWSGLLGASSSDNLFLSWAWIHTWWQVFGDDGAKELFILAAYRDQELVGLAPLYISSEKASVLPLRRLQFLGNHWRSGNNVRSEYMSFICRTGSEPEALGALLEYIENSREWDELVLCNCWSEAVTRQALEDMAASKGYSVRMHEPGETYSIEVAGSTFPDYLKALSSKTRLRLFNQRKKLEKKGDVVFRTIEPGEAGSLVERLNRFHQKRWGKNLFEGKRLEFNTGMIQAAAKRGWLDSSVLEVNGETVSILYDYRVGTTKYGFQLGFDQDFDKKISISQLHFGYAIEKAFDDNLVRFDFLRGMGKSRKSYKGSMAQPYRGTETLQIIRSPLLKLLYWIYDRKNALQNSGSEKGTEPN